MSQESRHTRGPWSVIESEHPVGTTYGIRTEGHSYVAQCHPKNGRKSEMGEVRANANLIAAAPEMLEVLTSLSPDEDPPSSMRDDETVTLLVTVRDLRRARAAIAKAEGRSNG